MPDGTTIYDLHGRLLRDTFGRDLSDGDAFLLFVLLHLYRIELDGPFLTDRPGLRAGDRVHAVTQRSCAETLASLWAGCDDGRANPAHWYHRWNGDWGSYGHAENLSEEEATRLGALRAELERHPFVRRLVPEDDDLPSQSASEQPPVGGEPTDELPGSRPSIRLGPIAYGVGWFWPFVMMVAGVGADRVRIPLSHKLSLTIISCALPLLIRRNGGRPGPGCSTALGLYCTPAVFVMWFWN